MPVKIEGENFLKQKELQESNGGDDVFGRFSEQSESEINWVKLHQMFDR